MITAEQTAQLCHEANAAYCRARGDYSHADWADTPQNIQESAIKSVLFHWYNPDKTPRESHEEWMRHKREEGWQYGQQKDTGQRKHPCFMPYDNLPVEEKAKDHIFKAISNTAAKLNAQEGTDMGDPDTQEQAPKDQGGAPPCLLYTSPSPRDS